MTQPLKGILVLDFSTLLPGPMATLMLAEAGAEVIKFERHWEPLLKAADCCCSVVKRSPKPRPIRISPHGACSSGS